MAVSMMHGSFPAPGTRVYSVVGGGGGPGFTSWLTNSIGVGAFFGGSGVGCCCTTVVAAGGLRFLRASISACILANLARISASLGPIVSTGFEAGPPAFSSAFTMVILID